MEMINVGELKNAELATVNVGGHFESKILGYRELFDTTLALLGRKIPASSKTTDLISSVTSWSSLTIFVLLFMSKIALNTTDLSDMSDKCSCIHTNTVRQKSSIFVVDTDSLNAANSGRMK